MKSPHLLARKHLFHYSSTILQALARPVIVYFVIIGNLLLMSSAFLFYHFEVGSNPEIKSFFDALWWAFSTVTTVGYGDIVPQSVYGRVVAIGLMLSGTVFFFGFTAILISIFSSLTAEEVKESERLTKAEYADVVRRLQVLTDKVERLMEASDAKKNNR